MITEQDDVDIFLAHYGVKGMKWGVRRDRKSGGGKSSGGDKKTTSGKKGDDKNTKAYKKELAKKPNPSPEQARKNFVNSVKKSEAKTNPSGVSKKDSDFDYAKAAKIAVGVAVVGVILYGAHQRYSDGGTILPKSPEFFTPTPGFNWKGEVYNGPSLTPGAEVSQDLFGEASTVSKKLVWSKAHVTEASWDQKEFSLPKGHVFKRLSTAAEDTFGDATYTTSSDADWNRYISTFRGEKAGRRFFEVSFKATKDVKVPDLTTRLDAVRESLGMDRNEALTWYSEASGGTWSDPRAKKFFDNLVSKGYDAIIDDMDAGVIADSPLVVINPSSFSEKVSRAITNGDVKQAAESLTELTNRRP